MNPPPTHSAARTAPDEEPTVQMAAALQAHLAVCNDLLALAHQEAEALKSPSPFPSTRIHEERKALLARLESALNGLVQKRVVWHRPGTDELARNPHLARLHQAALDTIMRVLVLDRENEQQLLRRGLLPARSLPPAEQARPNYVAQLYQRHTQS